MSPEDVVRAFFDTLEREGRDTASSRSMSPNVIFEAEGEPPTVGRDGWLARQGMFDASFPDMHEVATIDRVEGNIVYGKKTVTATHTGDLDLSAMELGVIAATNRQASIELDVTWTVVDDRISALAASSPEGSLLPTVLRQLGIELPQG